MKKNYKLPEENQEIDKVSEPIVRYNTQSEMTFSPPLTEEELKNAITGDELREHLHKFIDELFDRNENSVHPKR